MKAPSITSLKKQIPSSKRRAYLQTMALASGTALCGWMPSAKARESKGRSHPNLLFIFPDQFRLHALGIWQEPGYRDAVRGVTDPVHTPVLAKLAKESVLFTQAVSTHPVCSPYRAMLMSGMYPSRNGVMDLNCRNGRTQGLHHDITCFTDVLSDAGYATAYVGKTHWERTEPLLREQKKVWPQERTLSLLSPSASRTPPQSDTHDHLTQKANS
jgi:arylsulfatase A-like enzyme